MYQVKDLTQLTVKDLWKEVKRGEEWWGEINREVLSLVKIILESSLDEDVILTWLTSGSKVKPKYFPNCKIRRNSNA